MRRSYCIFLALAALFLAASSTTNATGLVREIKAGAVAHDVDGLWSGFSLEREAADLNVEAILSPSVPLLWGVIRPAVGGTVNFNGDTSHAYLDARWEVESPSGIFFAIGLGAAVHDGRIDPDKWDRKALGSRVLFHVPIELGYRFDQHNSLSVYFEHMSNAGLADSNEGMDFLGVRYGYRF